MFSADEIAQKAMYIAGELCLYTNHNTVMEILNRDVPSTLELTNPTGAIKLLLKHLGQSYIQSTSEFGLVDGDLKL